MKKNCENFIFLVENILGEIFSGQHKVGFPVHVMWTYLVTRSRTLGQPEVALLWPFWDTQRDGFGSNKWQPRAIQSRTPEILNVTLPGHKRRSAGPPKMGILKWPLDPMHEATLDNMKWPSRASQVIMPCASHTSSPRPPISCPPPPRLSGLTLPPLRGPPRPHLRAHNFALLGHPKWACQAKLCGLT